MIKTKKTTSANVASKKKSAFYKKIQFKHTVKLRAKQLDFIGYLIKLLLGILPFICLKLVEKSFNIFQEVGLSLSIPNSYYIVALLVGIFNTIYTLYISPISFSKRVRLKHKLLNIIETNNFYYEQKELNKITLSMTIKFYWLNEQLFLEVYTNGGKFTKQINELTPIFESALNMTVQTVQDDFPDHTTYILTNSNAQPINANDGWDY